MYNNYHAAKNTSLLKPTAGCMSLIKHDLFEKLYENDQTLHINLYIFAQPNFYYIFTITYEFQLYKLCNLFRTLLQSVLGVFLLYNIQEDKELE